MGLVDGTTQLIGNQVSPIHVIGYIEQPLLLISPCLEARQAIAELCNALPLQPRAKPPAQTHERWVEILKQLLHGNPCSDNFFGVCHILGYEGKLVWETRRLTLTRGLLFDAYGSARIFTWDRASHRTAVAAAPSPCQIFPQASHRMNGIPVKGTR